MTIHILLICYKNCDFLVIFDDLLPISPTKLQKIHQIRKKICIFRKKAVLLQPLSVILHTEVVYATSTFRRVAIVAQLVEQRIRNAWVAGLEAEN